MRLRGPQGQPAWLTYGMNVHPGGDADAFERALDEVVAPLRERLGATGAFGLAVRFDAEGIDALMVRDTKRRRALGERLRAEDLHVVTGNAFVHGRFHGGSLKDAVYMPGWETDARVHYTTQFAQLLASWWHAEPEVLSLSTAPGGWRGWRASADQALRYAHGVLRAARALRTLEDETGIHVRLGLEPEPRCTLETSDEASAFLQIVAHLPSADARTLAHLGVCHDLCHAAVCFEEPEEALDHYRRSGVTLSKVQVSAALEVVDPTAEQAREALARFDEPTYLHQVGARAEDGTVHLAEDLGRVLHDPSGLWQQRAPWRVHFHVPVHLDATGGLRTTRHDMVRALQHLLRTTPRGLPPLHLEVETYTWGVLPEAASAGARLVDGLEAELRATLEVAAEAGWHPAP